MAAFTPTVVPATPGTAPAWGNWIDPRLPGKWLQLIDPVVQTGVPSWCAYQSLDTSTTITQTWQPSTAYPLNAQVIPLGSGATGFWYQVTGAGTSGATQPVWPTTPGATVIDGNCTWTCMATTSPTLRVGEPLVIQGECTALAELVTVTAVAQTPPAGSNASPGLAFLATFNNPHDVGASVLSAPFPYWWSTRRTLYVILGSGGATNQDSRRRIDAFMQRIDRGVDHWAIVIGTPTSVSGGVIGPMTVGGPIGCAPIGPFNYTNST